MKKLLGVLLLAGFLFTSSVAADDKCIHVSKSAIDVMYYLEVHIGEHPFETDSEHFHYALNFNNSHTMVFSRDKRYMFIGVGERLAYYAVRPRKDSNIEIYRVDVEDAASPITQLFYVMKKEFIQLMQQGHSRFKKGNT